MRVREQIPHSLLVRWSADSGEIFEEWEVSCPYHADDYDKPCRIWASEDDHTGESEHGCWVQQSLENGIECVGIAIPSRSFAPWSVYVTGSGDEGPMLTDRSLISGFYPHATTTPENVECPNDCIRFGGKVPGHTRGSNWDWVPCGVCNGTMRVPTPEIVRDRQ